ncbi:hypothetical protein BDQ17DRAFT_990679 [Cyathus striatus]|nr:hypothetical protein BDQ17DRAFT_990679 [Cyathus striatus]
MESFMFQQHLGTNYVPSLVEKRQINNTLLETSSKEIANIDTEIDRLQKRRSILCDLAEQYRALVSPARRLSRDVLEEIFFACLPADRNPCMSATGAPMLLTHVFVYGEALLILLHASGKRSTSSFPYQPRRNLRF